MDGLWSHYVLLCLSRLSFLGGIGSAVVPAESDIKSRRATTSEPVPLSLPRASNLSFFLTDLFSCPARTVAAPGPESPSPTVPLPTSEAGRALRTDPAPSVSAPGGRLAPESLRRGEPSRSKGTSSAGEGGAIGYGASLLQHCFPMSTCFSASNEVENRLSSSVCVGFCWS